jgi:hypothetical protein
VDQPNSDAALMALNESAHLEYGTDFITAIDTPDEELTLRRMARLTGIEMKRPFATPIPIIGPSETGASQQWLLNQEFVGCPDADAPAFDGIKGDRSYKLMVRIYEELQNQNDPDTMGMTFGGFLENNHSESNWLLAALRAAQPHLCEKPGVHVSKPTTPEKRRELWGLAKEAAEGLATEGVKKAVEPISAALFTTVPFFSGAPPAFVFGFSIVLVHFAKRGFCAAEIQEQILTTLRWNQQ